MHITSIIARILLLWIPSVKNDFLLNADLSPASHLSPPNCPSTATVPSAILYSFRAAAAEYFTKLFNYKCKINNVLPLQLHDTTNTHTQKYPAAERILPGLRLLLLLLAFWQSCVFHISALKKWLSKGLPIKYVNYHLPRRLIPFAIGKCIADCRHGSRAQREGLIITDLFPALHQLLQTRPGQIFGNEFLLQINKLMNSAVTVSLLFFML